MKKISLFCFCLFSINAFSMSDYELCKMLDDSGDANETIKYIGESYLEGKNPTKDAQLFLNVAISGAMVDSNPYFGGAGSFISQCLKGLKEYKSKIFE